MIKIESSANDTFKHLLSLTTAKGLKKEKLFILSGKKLIEEFLKNPQLKIHCEIVTAKQAKLTLDVPLFELSPLLFKQLDTLGTHFNLLVLHQPKVENWNPLAPPKGLEVICPLGDPGNLGAIARSCEAFGVKKLILTEEAAHPFLAKAVKASAGSLLRISLVAAPKLAQIHQDLAGDMIALKLSGTPIEQFAWPQDCRLLVGEEGPGLPDLDFHDNLCINTENVESLNAVVAASLAMFVYTNKAKK